VWIKSNRNCGDLEGAGAANYLGNDDLVSAVHAVKNTDGDHTATPRG